MMYAHKNDFFQNAKWAFTTRHVTRLDAMNIDPDVSSAVSGDLLVCQVTKIGSHKRVQLSSGRPSMLYIGDLIVVACGARYASDQFEGIAQVSAESADLLAGGGVVGQMRHRNAKQAAPTQVKPLGKLRNKKGCVMNLAHYRSVPAVAQNLTDEHRPTCPAIFVVGTAMNSGKTTATAAIAHGLMRAGARVAAIKATGTGAFGDVNAYEDAGAHVVRDFTDTGLVSTYQVDHATLVASTKDLLRHAADQGCDIAVVELADGIFQQETSAYLKCPEIRSLAQGFVFAAPDSVAVAGGTAALSQLDIDPLFVTGLVSASPLSAQEAEDITGTQVVSRESLLDPAFAASLLAQVSHKTSTTACDNLKASALKVPA